MQMVELRADSIRISLNIVIMFLSQEQEKITEGFARFHIVKTLLGKRFHITDMILMSCTLIYIHFGIFSTEYICSYIFVDYPTYIQLKFSRNVSSSECRTETNCATIFHGLRNLVIHHALKVGGENQDQDCICEVIFCALQRNLISFMHICEIKF